MQRLILDRNRLDSIFKGGGSFIIRLVGRSMEPVFRSSQSVSVGRIASLDAGQCYLFRYGAFLAVHRLAALRGDTAVFLGDNCRVIERVAVEAVYGHVDDGRTEFFHTVMAYINRLFLSGHSRSHALTVRRNRMRCRCIRSLLIIDSVFKISVPIFLTQPTTGAVHEKKV